MATNPPYGKCYPFGPPTDGGDDQRAQAPEWRHLAGAWGDGIVNDTGADQSAFNLARSSSSRQVTLRLGEFRLRGIHFEPTQDTIAFTLTDAPAGQTRIDRIIARLDPTAQQITFIKREGTPATSSPSYPALTRASGGVWEYALWNLIGGNAPANSLQAQDGRFFLAPSGQIERLADLSNSGDFPRGTRVYERSTGCTLVRGGLGATPQWVNVSNPPWTALSLGAEAKAGSPTPETRVVNGRREFRGQVLKTSGSWGNGIYTVGSVSDAPGAQRGNALLPVGAGTGGVQGVNAWVAADGTVRFAVPASTTVTSFYLDPMTYALEP